MNHRKVLWGVVAAFVITAFSGCYLGAALAGRDNAHTLSQMRMH